MAGSTPIYNVYLRGETPSHTDDSGYLTNTPSSADSLDSLPTSNWKLSQGCKCKYRNSAPSTPGTHLSHSVHCSEAYLSVCKKRKASLAKFKLLHSPDSLLSSTEVKDSSSAVCELLSQSKGEPLGGNDFDELPLVENSFDSQENGTLDNSAILYDEMALPHEGCSQDSGTGSQEMVNLYYSLKRDLSIEGYDMITNELKMSTREDVSQDPLTKQQIFEETTRHKIPISLLYSHLKIPCQTGQEKIDFLYLLGERSDHHTVVKVILSYLEPKDLTAVVVVSKTWNRVCKSDRDAHRRIHRYLKRKRDNKENTVLQVRRVCLA
jgi:hypothetical protein